MSAWGASGFRHNNGEAMGSLGARLLGEKWAAGGGRGGGVWKRVCRSEMVVVQCPVSKTGS